MNEIDNLLDATLDDLADAPSFTPFSPGAHAAHLSLNLKEIQGKQVVECVLVGVETQELADPATGTPLKAGDSCSTIFNLANEYGQGDFKMVCTALAESLGTVVPREIIEAAKGVDVMVLTGTSPDKNDKDKLYLNIKNVAVL